MRIETTSGRYYKAQDGKLYPSVTTILGILPETDGVRYLKSSMGVFNYEQMLRKKAAYGTVLHAIFARFLQTGMYELEQTRGFIEEFGTGEESEYMLNRDFACLAEWAKSRNIEVLEVEKTYFYEGNDYRFAGTLDLVCNMDWNAGTKTKPDIMRRLAIVDLKSGKNGFRDEHRYQLAMYSQAYEAKHITAFPILVNLSPKNWEKTPIFHEKVWERTADSYEIPMYLSKLFHLLNNDEIKEIEKAEQPQRIYKL